MTMTSNPELGRGPTDGVEPGHHGLVLVVEHAGRGETIIQIRVVPFRREVGPVSDEHVEVVSVESGSPELPCGVDLLQRRLEEQAANGKDPDARIAGSMPEGLVEFRRDEIR